MLGWQGHKHFFPAPDWHGNFRPLYAWALDMVLAAEARACFVVSHEACYRHHIPPGHRIDVLPMETASLAETLYMALRFYAYTDEVAVLLPDVVAGPATALATVLQAELPALGVWRAPINVIDRLTLDAEGYVVGVRRHRDEKGESRTLDRGWGIIAAPRDRLLHALIATELDLQKAIALLRPKPVTIENGYYYDLGDPIRYAAYMRRMMAPKRLETVRRNEEARHDRSD